VNGRPLISICMPYHENPLMLAAHYAHLKTLPDFIRGRIEVIICDDASTQYPAYHDPNCPVEVRIFRIEPPHVMWSHRCATNIAAHHASGLWLLLTDIDHIAPVDTLQHMICQIPSADPDRVYTFKRVDTRGRDIKPHPDSWLIHRDMWDNIGGWDERFRGRYGQNARIWDRVRHFAGEPYTLNYPLKLFSRAEIADADTPDEHRGDRVTDKYVLGRLARELRRNGTFFQSHQLTVPYKEVLS